MLAPALRQHGAKRCLNTRGVARVQEELTVMHKFPAYSSSPRQMLFSSSIRKSAAELLKKEQFIVSKVNSLVKEMSTHGAK